MSRFVTQYTYSVLSEHLFTPKGKSQTIPNDSYTIREIMDKHTQGIMPPIWKEGWFEDGEVTMEQDVLDNMDIFEVDMLLHELRNELSQKHNYDNELKIRKIAEKKLSAEAFQEFLTQREELEKIDDVNP